MEGLETRLMMIYHHLLDYYGAQHWWPADDDFEVMIGAILTQSAAWSNVEKAITNLKNRKVLSPEALCEITLEELSSLIYSCGYYNAKASKIKALVQWLGERFDDDLSRLFALDIPQMRHDLLEVKGIGKETADSIILYAARKPIFVIDAYTHRIMQRLGMTTTGSNYEELQNLFMNNLPLKEELLNEYHALLVAHGKQLCKKIPRCERCPLKDTCEDFLRLTLNKHKLPGKFSQESHSQTA